MIDLDVLYFKWLLSCLGPDVADEVVYVADLLHNCPFLRRVGRDLNRAEDGANLRKEFFEEFADSDLDHRLTDEILMKECTWFEMLVALARHLDFLYEGGVEGRFIELVRNMGLQAQLQWIPRRTRAVREYDQRFVDAATNDIDNNRFDRNGVGGLFPLRRRNHPDQRKEEIWDQHAAYFRERLEGVLWTSTS